MRMSDTVEHVLRRVDAVNKTALHGLAAFAGQSPQSLSPMVPSDAYAPPSTIPTMAVEEMHPFLQKLIAEHEPFLGEVDAFEETLLSIQNSGYTRAADGQLKHFLNYLDEEFIAHNRREEEALFPLLKKRLFAADEHGGDAEPLTPVDLMQDEHLKIVQLAAVILNFLGLAFRFPDQPTRLVILDAALEQARNLVELLRLHVYREDNLVFPLAQQLITEDEFMHI